MILNVLDDDMSIKKLMVSDGPHEPLIFHWLLWNSFYAYMSYTIIQLRGKKKT